MAAAAFTSCVSDNEEIDLNGKEVSANLEVGMYFHQDICDYCDIVAECTDASGKVVKVTQPINKEYTGATLAPLTNFFGYTANGLPFPATQKVSVTVTLKEGVTLPEYVNGYAGVVKAGTINMSTGVVKAYLSSKNTIGFRLKAEKFKEQVEKGYYSKSDLTVTVEKTK